MEFTYAQQWIICMLKTFPGNLENCLIKASKLVMRIGEYVPKNLILTLYEGVCYNYVTWGGRICLTCVHSPRARAYSHIRANHDCTCYIRILCS